MDVLDKIKGTIFGQAIGDALGLGTEFLTDKDMAQYYPNGLTYYDEIFQDYHRKKWKPGEWTDDTDMMLCIAHAIIEDKGVVLSHIAMKFKQWATGTPRGIGRHTQNVLLIGDYCDKPSEVSKLIWEMGCKKSASNGGVMRTSIVGVLQNDVEQTAADICRLTHYDARCVGSCVIVSEIIHSLIYESRTMTMKEIIEIGDRYDVRIGQYIAQYCDPDVKQLNLQESYAMGYTLKTLTAALWAYWYADSFEEGLLAIVNSGGDADTNAAVGCAILGAKYGFNSIPRKYINGLINKSHLEMVTNELCSLI